MVHIGNDWDEVLREEFSSENYQKIRKFLKAEYSCNKCYPDMYDIFNALKLTAFENVKAVILGQDPYHGFGQAHGLCFSVKPNVQKPPSLKNIFLEYKSDLGLPIPQSGCLTSWANEGVLLLNTVLTVREGQPNSHKDCGWQTFTDDIIKKLNLRTRPIAFILWGANARAKKKYITNPNHFIVESAHPSPLSAYNGFFGSKPFSKVNEFLINAGEKAIDWQIKE